MTSLAPLMLVSRVLMSVCECAAAYTIDRQRKSNEIFRAESAPVIDGRLDDEVWRHAAVVDDFHQTAPADGALPTEITVVRVAYDDEYLYIAADLRDSDAQEIRAKQMIQGKMFFSDDRFWVTIDSFNNKRNDYFFQVNANGVRREALRENNARFIEEWVAIWHAESTVHEEGWSTEIAIPFKSISFAPEADTWGINFGRGIVRKQEFDMWSSHERQDWPAYGGEVRGISEIQQGLGLDVVPSINLSQQRDLLLGGDHSGFEPSLDIRYRITPSLSATFTLNTDFSTAEVDEQQVALDRFSLFFPEKRDFFLQDAGIFEFGNIDTNGRPFFSRRIGLSDEGEAVGIKGGAKLTGRLGDLSLGALAIRQEANGNVDAKDLFVARGSYNVLDESAVGFVVTHGDPTSNETNSVVGVDFLYRNSDGPFGEILTGRFWAQQSRSSDVDGDERAFGAALEIPSDRLSAYVEAQLIEENFRPALGFVNRAGIRRIDTGLRYRTRPQQGRWRAINNRIDFSLVTDMDGVTLSQTTAVRPVSFYSHADDFLFVEWERNKESVRSDFALFGRLDVPAGNYEFDRYRAEISTGMQRPVRVVLSVQDGGFFGGDRLEKFAEFQWRQSAHLFLGLSITENDVDLPSGSFTSHLASLRTDFAFNSRWSWSNLLQYDNTAELFGINSRLRFVPEAGKEMIVVLNHGAAVDPANHFTSIASDLNLKVSYTFRY
ncbi:MAG: carbohydrate binding family 9 domain-containing protein [Gammaproteobacteria bacterium]|nr:carbohydrate binding family 9 domain-containing protein [Gammaproteobacteria bacterium]